MPAPQSIPPDAAITRLLSDLADGRPTAADELLQCVYEHLRAIARSRMSSERPGHTLQATALVNEAYMRLVGGNEVAWRDRGHFYGAAAEAMRRILIEHARRRAADKRGGERQRMPLSVCDLAANDDPQQILNLDRALVRLEASDPAAAEVVRLRFFAGLTVEQAATALGVSKSTVKREWIFARAKLFRFLEQEPDDRS